MAFNKAFNFFLKFSFSALKTGGVFLGSKIRSRLLKLTLLHPPFRKLPGSVLSGTHGSTQKMMGKTASLDAAGLRG